MGKHDKEMPKRSKLVFLSIFRILLWILLLFSILHIIQWYIDNRENAQLEEMLSATVTMETVENRDTTQTSYMVDFEALKQANTDTVGWLKVPGTSIEYPVVQAADNQYYLTRNFHKDSNSAGWIFADYRNTLDGRDKNIIVYGHNRKDMSMFGTLQNILKEEWYTNMENHILHFITEEEPLTYQVFSVYQIQNENYYIDTQFADDEFAEFIYTLKSRSVHDFSAEVTPEDSILTLSTCANNNAYRVVLHAKKINAN